MLILAVAKDLDELFEDGSLATVAALGELGRVVVVTIHIAIMLVIAVLSPKDSRAE